MDESSNSHKKEKHGEGRKSLFGRRPLYIKKTNLKKLKSMNEKRNSSSPKTPSSCHLSNNSAVPTVVAASRESTRSVNSSKSNCSNRNSAVSPLSKQCIMEGKGRFMGTTFSP